MNLISKSTLRFTATGGNRSETLILSCGEEYYGIETVNPTTAETIRSYQEMTPAEVDGVIEHFHQDFFRWREATFAERAELMKAAA